MSGLDRMVSCGVIAPMVIRPGAVVMPDRPRADRSTITLGLFSRCFSTGMKVCPPANALASTSVPSVCKASGTLDGL